jgi:hypothetical protein
MVEMQRVVAEPLNELILNELAACDTFVIQTQNSRYSFIVTEPHLHQGILSGGSFGERLVKAVLIPSPADLGQFVTDAHRLRIGARMMFVVESRRGPIGGMTSAVTKIYRLTRAINMPVTRFRTTCETAIQGEAQDQRK